MTLLCCGLRLCVNFLSLFITRYRIISFRGLFRCFYSVYISVRAPGIIRPSNERTEIKAAVSELLTVFISEKGLVKRNDLLMTCGSGADGKKGLKPKSVREKILFMTLSY
jgi:hypothetical protein